MHKCILLWSCILNYDFVKNEITICTIYESATDFYLITNKDLIYGLNTHIQRDKKNRLEG